MAVKLSILIPYTSSRKEMMQSLIYNIRSQMQWHKEDVELILDDNEYDCVGVKRNRLLNLSSGDYVVFVDSDDRIHDDYVGIILEAIKSDPDCVSINGFVTVNGDCKTYWDMSIKHGLPWRTENGVYIRTPNHISPVKRSIALAAGFPDTNWGEDAEYSARILPHLKTEVIISHPIYHYDKRS